MTADYKIGNVVKLRSGGPLMTVTSIGRDYEGQPTVTCTWMDRDNREHSSTYPVEAVAPHIERIREPAPLRVNRRRSGNDDGTGWMAN